MRALIVTSLYPTPERPALGSFVRDQVEALRRIGSAEIDVFSFAPGDPGRYVKAAEDLRRRHRRDRFDIVHSHFGLSAWPALAAHGRKRVVTLHGTDLEHPRSRVITLTALRFQDLVAPVSGALARTLPAWMPGGPTAVLPCGVNLERFHPIPRARARAELGLEADRPYLLFPSDPRRPEKRYDLAQTLADAAGVRLLALESVIPEQVPLWVNACNAVLVPSEREGFGLAALEALACDVPVLATPVGIAPTALAGVPGTLCAEFDRDRWLAALAPHLAAEDPRVDGRAHAEAFSAPRMAARVLAAWQSLLST
ncbi:MAG: glycosyltransferase [Actinomycetota bacterium]|nr:glycosyltransferase [Actinomycetota bacterium]